MVVTLSSHLHTAINTLTGHQTDTNYPNNAVNKA